MKKMVGVHFQEDWGPGRSYVCAQVQFRTWAHLFWRLGVFLAGPLGQSLGGHIF